MALGLVWLTLCHGHALSDASPAHCPPHRHAVVLDEPMGLHCEGLSIGIKPVALAGELTAQVTCAFKGALTTNVSGVPPDNTSLEPS